MPSRRPLTQRTREVRDRLDLLGDDEDVATLRELLALAERDEQEQADAAQVTLDVEPDGLRCVICGDPITPGVEGFYHEEQGWTQPRAAGGTNALRNRRVTGRRAHVKCVGTHPETTELPL